MTQPNHKRLLTAATDLATALADAGLTPTIIGGVAVSIVAKPRFTEDVDALVVFDTDQIEPLLDTLSRHGFRARFSKMAELARSARMITLIHEETRTVVDIALGCMPFETEVQERSTPSRVSGVDIRVPTPEDLIIMKAVANRPKDLEDIRIIAEINPDLDRGRIRFWVEQYADLLDNPGLWSGIEPLLGGGAG
jgi:predicted nucleotidyltransferase